MTQEKMKVCSAIHRLDHVLTRYISSETKKAGCGDVPMMHGWIIRYLYQHQDVDVFQRDIEQQFSIGRSAVTSILQQMEKNGLIRRVSVEHDARLKKVELTEKGISDHERMDQLADRIDEDMLQGISEEDQQLLLQIVQQIENNLLGKDAGKNCMDNVGKGECHAKDITQPS